MRCYVPLVVASRKTWQSYYLEGNGVDRVKLVELFGKDKWEHTSFVQFLTVSDNDVDAIRAREPRIPHLGGPFVPRFVAPRPRAKSAESERSRTDRDDDSEPNTPKSYGKVSTDESERSRTPRQQRKTKGG